MGIEIKVEREWPLWAKALAIIAVFAIAIAVAVAIVRVSPPQPTPAPSPGAAPPGGYESVNKTYTAVPASMYVFIRDPPRIEMPPMPGMRNVTTPPWVNGTKVPNCTGDMPCEPPSVNKSLPRGWKHVHVFSVQSFVVDVYGVYVHVAAQWMSGWNNCSVVLKSVDLAALLNKSVVLALCNLPLNVNVTGVMLVVSNATAVINGTTVHCRVPSNRIYIPVAGLAFGGRAIDFLMDVNAVGNVVVSGRGECLVIPVIHVAWKHR